MIRFYCKDCDNHTSLEDGDSVYNYCKFFNDEIPKGEMLIERTTTPFSSGNCAGWQPDHLAETALDIQRLVQSAGS